MVEWALDALQVSPVVIYQGRKINLKAPWDRIPVLDAIERITGVAIRNFDAASCRRAVEAAMLEIRPDWAENTGFLFSVLMDHVQSQLGNDRPVFLTEWPFFQTTSAAANPDDPKLARRSELFIGGMEIADGFAGLADADMQTQLFNNALEFRKSEGKEVVDLDGKYLEAMRVTSTHGAGMAMGFDRLVMLLTDQSNIKNVLAFGWDEV